MSLMTNTRRLTGGAALFLLLATVGPAVAGGREAAYNTVLCGRAAGSITVDGRLDEPDWATAPATPVFTDMVTGAPAPFPTLARFLRDRENLYVAYEVADTRIWSECVERDVNLYCSTDRGLYNEGFIELFLDPDDDGRNQIEIHVNPQNAVTDQYKTYCTSWYTRSKLGLPHFRAPANQATWNLAGMRTAVRLDGTLNKHDDTDRGWTVEIAIPFASLRQFAGGRNLPPREGDSWRIFTSRRYRLQRGAPVHFWSWPVLQANNCHRADKWGYLLFEDRPAERPARLNNLPPARFDWKALWAKPPRSRRDAEKLAALADDLGFNVIILQATGYNQAWYRSRILKPAKGLTIDPLAEVIRAAHPRGIKVYAWVIYLADSGSDSMRQKAPEFYQELKPGTKVDTGPRRNPDRENRMAGRWLCPDRGLTDHEKRISLEIVTRYPVNGLAIDYLGYQNYRDCHCEYSNRRRAEFENRLNAREGFYKPWGETMVADEFSEASLVRWTEELVAAVKAVRPGLKTAIHLYPDFDPNPLYGHRLPVDYLGQTVAWFYQPYWSPEKVYYQTRLHQSLSGRYQRKNRFVPFVGVARGKLLKSPEQVRQELRIAGNFGNGAVMFAFSDVLLENPALAAAVKEELKGW